MLWIETDLEPDDVLALAIFPKADYYVVGEGEAKIKYQRMKGYLDMLNITDYILIKGNDGPKKYELDGKEFEHLPKIEHVETNYKKHFENFCNSENPIMISIKPMRELAKLFSKNQNIKKLLGNITFYAYGGFNFRTLLGTYKNVLKEILNSFKEVHIYESFYATGENNSFNKDTFPKLKEILFTSNKPFYKTFVKLIRNWNKCMLSSFDINVLKGASLERALKIIKNIEGNEDFQLLVADFALAVLIREGIVKYNMPVTNVRFETYTLFDETLDNSSNIYFYKNVDMEELKNLILKYL